MKLEQIHQVAVHAEDLMESIAFYRDLLGAKYLGKFDPPGLVFFDFSGVRLLLEQNAPISTLYFWVEDIEESYKKLKSKGVKFSAEPHLVFRDDQGLFGAAGQEEWMTFFNDPGGNLLALVTRKTVSR